MQSGGLSSKDVPPSMHGHGAAFSSKEVPTREYADTGSEGIVYTHQGKIEWQFFLPAINWLPL